MDMKIYTVKDLSEILFISVLFELETPSTFVSATTT